MMDAQRQQVRYLLETMLARINHERGFNSADLAGYLQCFRRHCAVYPFALESVVVTGYAGVRYARCSTLHINLSGRG